MPEVNRQNRVLGLLLFGILAIYLVLAAVATFTAPESIDEFSLDFWSTRLADRGLRPLDGLTMPPELDREMGFLGFIRSGHFVYNRTLDQIIQGQSYSITPMVHLVPIYVHALAKFVFGRGVYYFTHLFLLLLGLALPLIVHYRKNHKTTELYWLGLILLLTPAILINATYVMVDGLGYFGFSLFSFLLFSATGKRSCWGFLVAVVPAALVVVFFKPVGWVLLPWALALVLIQRGTSIWRKIAASVLILAAVAGVTALAERIYPSFLWVGYQNPINHFLKRNLVITTEEIENWMMAMSQKEAERKAAETTMAKAEPAQKEPEGKAAETTTAKAEPARKEAEGKAAEPVVAKATPDKGKKAKPKAPELSVAQKKLVKEISSAPFVSVDQMTKKLKEVLATKQLDDTELRTVAELAAKKVKKEESRPGVFKNPFTAQTNIIYGIPTLFLAFPLMLFLLIAVARDLWRELRRVNQVGWWKIFRTDLPTKVLYLCPYVFFFFFYMLYNHSTPLLSYLSLSNPTFRYFLLPFISLVWYVIAFDVSLSWRRLVVPLVVVQALILLAFPNNLIQRVGFRFYSAVLQQELRRVVPEKALLLSAYKYDKFFPVEKTPAYSFLGHQRNRHYTACFSNPRYRPLLGGPEAVLGAVRQKGFVPILIYPDMDIPDSHTLMEPYKDLEFKILAEIDMAAKAGILAWILPQDKRRIFVAEVEEIPPNNGKPKKS